MSDRSAEDLDSISAAAGTLGSELPAVESSEDRLLVLLEDYLEAIEADEQFEQQVWMDRVCRQNPDLAEDIREGIDRIDCLHTMSSMKEDALPQIAGHRLHREIGRGGMGVVYEATEVALGRRVALKTMPSAMAGDSKQFARFMIEAQAAARLEHPHITPIYRVGTSSRVHFLSMKLIVGRSLDELASAKVVPRSQCIDWMIDASEALDHAHGCGVIHRDVKPSNLMIDTGGHLWVTDFGLARITDDVSLTGSGDLVGTLAYMSPEQVAGDPVDRRTDVYAIGLLLFELLTGRRAIEGASRAEVLAKVARGGEFHVRGADRSIDRDLDTVIAKATARDPSERYTTAGQLAEDLRRCRQSRPILAHRPSLTRRSSKWIRRHSRLVAAIATVFLLATVGSWVATWRVARANLATQAALDESQRNLRRTEEILDQFGLMAAQRLRHVEGAEEVRRELLRQTLQYYEDFANQVNDDQRLLVQNAITHFKAAQIIAEIGATDEAVAAYDRALQLFDTADPQTQLAKRTHALCLNNLAMLKAESGQASLAENLYQQAISRQRRLLESPLDKGSAGRLPIIIDLAKSHGNLGMWLIDSGQNGPAVRQFESGLAVVKELAAENPEAGMAEAMLLSNLGFALRHHDDPRAMAVSQQAIDRLKQLQRQPGDDSLTQMLVVRLLASGLSNRAALTIDSGLSVKSTSEAIVDYRESITLLRSLVVANRHDRRLVSELAITENNLGRLLLRTGKADVAIKHFEDAAESLDRLCQLDPQAEHYRSSLGGVLHNLGRAQATAGQIAAASETLKRSIEVQQTALDQPQQLSPHARQSRSELLERTISDYQTLSHSS